MTSTSLNKYFGAELDDSDESDLCADLKPPPNIFDKQETTDVFDDLFTTPEVKNKSLIKKYDFKNGNANIFSVSFHFGTQHSFTGYIKPDSRFTLPTISYGLDRCECEQQYALLNVKKFVEIKSFNEDFTSFYRRDFINAGEIKVYKHQKCVLYKDIIMTSVCNVEKRENDDGVFVFFSGNDKNKLRYFMVQGVNENESNKIYKSLRDTYRAS